jgi:hypothetical protein
MDQQRISFSFLPVAFNTSRLSLTWIRFKRRNLKSLLLPKKQSQKTGKNIIMEEASSGQNKIGPPKGQSEDEMEEEETPLDIEMRDYLFSKTGRSPEEIAKYWEYHHQKVLEF